MHAHIWTFRKGGPRLQIERTEADSRPEKIIMREDRFKVQGEDRDPRWINYVSYYADIAPMPTLGALGDIWVCTTSGSESIHVKRFAETDQLEWMTTHAALDPKSHRHPHPSYPDRFLYCDGMRVIWVSDTTFYNHTNTAPERPQKIGEKDGLVRVVYKALKDEPLAKEYAQQGKKARKPRGRTAAVAGPSRTAQPASDDHAVTNQTGSWLQPRTRASLTGTPTGSVPTRATTSVRDLPGATIFG